VPGYGQMLETAERWRWMPGLEQVESGVALTFDDGPDPEGTPAVLDALDAAGVRATFFVVGEQLMKHHAIAREALARGHDLGLHGFQHVRHDTLRGQARDDVARSIGTFEMAVGRKPRFFRPPYGAFNEYSYEACADLGLQPVYWSSWGLDWESIGPERIAEIAGGDLADGAIVLLHDSTRYAPRESAQPTADAIGPIAAAAAERGLALVTVGEAAGDVAPNH
jgi:peptidoglycan/xylan/chitin deacetylase (PgdA/CDA1 family)